MWQLMYSEFGRCLECVGVESKDESRRKQVKAGSKAPQPREEGLG